MFHVNIFATLSPMEESVVSGIDLVITKNSIKRTENSTNNAIRNNTTTKEVQKNINNGNNSTVAIIYNNSTTLNNYNKTHDFGNVSYLKRTTLLIDPPLPTHAPDQAKPLFPLNTASQNKEKKVCLFFYHILRYSMNL